MFFNEVHEKIPYLSDGELHSVTTEIYPAVRVKQPGRHAFDTDPIGGDFVVEVSCDNAKWDWKQFTHADLFADLQSKYDTSQRFFLQHTYAKFLARVVDGTIEPIKIETTATIPGLDLTVLLQTSQVLAVAEHRRYARYEANGGGRFLPVRFALGIIFGHWSAAEATRVQRRGVHGLRELTKLGGNPPTVRKLCKTG